MSKKQSVWDSVSASRPRPYEEVKMELNLQDAARLAYSEKVDVSHSFGSLVNISRVGVSLATASISLETGREVEAYRQRLHRIATERARAAAEAAAEAEANLLRILLPFLLPRNLQLFEELSYSGISDDESSTITTVDSPVDTMEGEEVNR